jgi:hypothetical protein
MRKLLSAVLLAAAIGVGAIATSVVHGEQLNQTPAPSGGGQIDEMARAGVVDVDRLVRQHPDAHKLDEIDKEITYLSSQLDSPAGMGDDGSKAAIDQLNKYKKQLVDEAQAHADRVKADLDAKKAAVESTLKAEANNLSSEMQKYTDQLKKEAGADAPAPSKSDIKGKQQQFDSKMRSYLSDLDLVAQRNMAARKIEIERRAQANLAGEKRKLDAELAAKMDAVMKADQSQKLQLQLDLQTTQDEEQRKKIQDKLQSLTSAEEDKRDALRRELAGSFEAAKRAELSRDQEELTSYKKKLDDDIRRQLGTQKNRVLHDVVGDTKTPAAPPANIKELQARLEAKQRELKGQFEAKKNALVAGLQAESKAAENDLNSQRKIIEDKLEAERKRVLKSVMHQRELLSKEDEKRQAHIKEQLDELKKQRQHVYDTIVDQIRDQVAVVAKENHVPLVVGGYRVNVNCKDLTDQTLQLVGKK